MENVKKLTKKQKGIIAGIVVVVAAAAVTAGVMLYNPLKLKKEEMTVEFGQAISTEAKTYLKKDVDKDIVKNTKVSYKKNLVEGKEYDQVGEYTVKLKYKNKEKEVAVSVKDTTKPEFNATATAGIETIEGVDLKFNELIKATDLSGAEVTFDAAGVNLKKAGTYTLKATAVDKYDNKTAKDIKVTVKDKPANMTGSSVSVDSKTGKVTVNAKTYKAPSNTGKTYSSNSRSKTYSSGSKSYSSKKSSSKSSSSSGGYNGPTHGNVAGSGHTWDYEGSEEWNPEWD